MKSKEQTAVLLFFIDGLGIGERGENNPLAQIENIEPLAHFKRGRLKINFDDNSENQRADERSAAFGNFIKSEE